MADEAKKSGSFGKIAIGAVIGFLVASAVGGLVAVVGGSAVVAFAGGVLAFLMMRSAPAPAPVVQPPVAITAAPAPEPVPEPAPLPDPLADAVPDAGHSTSGNAPVASTGGPVGSTDATVHHAASGSAPTKPPSSDDDFQFDPDPAPASGTKTRPPTTSADHPATTASGAKITVVGTAKVALISGDKRYALPANVPPGKYDIEATFPGEPAVVSGKITVGTDDASIVCSDTMGICRPK